MCLIVAPRNPDGQLVLTPEQLTQAFARNSDGWGLMWLDEDKDGPTIQRMRGLKLDELLTAYEVLKNKRGLHLHLRTRTHGKTDTANCHPFPIGGDTYLMHNGVFRIDEIFNDRSDTWHYAALTSTRLLEYGSTDPIFTDEGWQKATERFFGGGSKGVFLRADGKRFIANESAGTWFEEQWYSNTSGAPWTYTRSFTTYGGSSYVYMGGDYDAAVKYRSYADGTWKDEDEKTPSKGVAVGEVVGQLFAGWRNSRNKTPCGYCKDGNGTAKCMVCDERVCTNCREWVVEERAHICLDCMAKLMALDEEKTDATKTDDRHGGVGEGQQQGAAVGEVGTAVGEDPQRVG